MFNQISPELSSQHYEPIWDQEEQVYSQYYGQQQYNLQNQFFKVSPSFDFNQVEVPDQPNNQYHYYIGHNYNHPDGYSDQPQNSQGNSQGINQTLDNISDFLCGTSDPSRMTPQESPREDFRPEQAYQQIVQMIKKKNPPRKRSRSPQTQSALHNVPTFFAKHLTTFLLKHATKNDLALVQYINTPARMSKQTIKVYMLASERLRRLCLYFFENDLIIRKIFNSKAKDKPILLECLPEYIRGAMDPHNFNNQ